MKKRFVVIFIVLLLVFASLSFASIEQVNLQNKLAGVVRNIRSNAVSSAINLGNLIQDAKDAISGYGSLLDADDKTKLQTLDIKVEDAKTKLDEIVAYIDANFGSIK